MLDYVDENQYLQIYENSLEILDRDLPFYNNKQNFDVLSNQGKCQFNRVKGNLQVKKDTLLRNAFEFAQDKNLPVTALKINNQILNMIKLEHEYGKKEIKM